MGVSECVCVVCAYCVIPLTSDVSLEWNCRDLGLTNLPITSVSGPEYHNRERLFFFCCSCQRGALGLRDTVAKKLVFPPVMERSIKEEERAPVIHETVHIL